MATSQFRTFRLTDRQLLEAFDKIRSDFQGAQEATVIIHPGNHVQPIQVSLPGRRIKAPMR